MFVGKSVFKLIKLKVEPDLTLVQQTFSVRYKCYQSLEIKVYSGFATVHHFDSEDVVVLIAPTKFRDNLQ